MNRDIITITVSGPAGSGKSSISYLLKKFLEKEKMNVSFEHNQDWKDESHFESFIETHIDTRKDVLKKKIIILNEMNIRKDSFDLNEFKKLPKKVRRRYKLSNLDI